MIGCYKELSICDWLLQKSAPSRIVNVSSVAHTMCGIMWDNIMQESRYNSLKAYGQSKTANILHILELSKRLEGNDVLMLIGRCVYIDVVHQLDLCRIFFKSIEKLRYLLLHVNDVAKTS